MTQQYEYQTSNNSDKKVIATYDDGVLTALEGIHLIPDLWANVCINAPIPFEEKLVQAKAKDYEGMVTVHKVSPDSVSYKIAAFCRMYSAELNIKYTKRKGDVTALNNIPVSDELLKTYFNNNEWWGKQPKSISNYCKNINAVQQLISKRVNGDKKRFPMEWSKQAESKIKTADLPQWWKHLRKLGFSPVKDSTGNTIKWSKVTQIIVVLIVCLVFGGCGLLHRNPKVLVETTVEVEIKDTIEIKGDSLEALTDLTEWWTGEKDTMFTIETEEQTLVIEKADSVEVWEWFSKVPDSKVDSADILRKIETGKFVKITSTTKDKKLPIEIKKKVPVEFEYEPPTGIPDIALKEVKKGGKTGLIAAFVIFLYGIIMFFVNRKRRENEK